MRKATSDSIDHAVAQSAEPTANKVTAVTQVGLDPNLSIAQPVIGMTMATASR